MKFFDHSIERQLRKLASLSPSDAMLRRLQAELKQLTPEWAEKQHQLGQESLSHIQGENRKAAIAHLEAAIAHFKNALHVYTKDAFPDPCTRVLCELGNAYRNLSEKNRKTRQANLQAAVTSYERALQIAEDSCLDLSWIEAIRELLTEARQVQAQDPSVLEYYLVYPLAHVYRQQQARVKPRVQSLQRFAKVLMSQSKRTHRRWPIILATTIVMLVMILALIPMVVFHPLSTKVEAASLHLTASFSTQRPQPGAVWIRTAVWSPDGNYIAVLWDDNIMQVWSGDGKKVVFQPEGGWGVGITWSPDGKYLAGVRLNDTIQVWDVLNQKSVYTSSSYDAPVEAIAWSPVPNSTLIAFVSNDEPHKAIRILDFATKVIKEPFFYPQGQKITSLVWSPAGQYLVSGDDSSDGLVQTWDSSTGRHLSTYYGHHGPITSVSWSSDGKSIASASYDGQVLLWDTRTDRQIGHISQHEPVFAVAWNPKSSAYLALASYDGSVQVWTREGRLIASYPSDQQNNDSGIHSGLFTVAWSPDQQSIVTGGYVTEEFGGILAVHLSGKH